VKCAEATANGHGRVAIERGCLAGVTNRGYGYESITG